MASLAGAAMGGSGDMGPLGVVLLGLVYLGVGAGAALAAWRLARPAATPTR